MCYWFWLQQTLSCERRNTKLNTCIPAAGNEDSEGTVLVAFGALDEVGNVPVAVTVDLLPCTCKGYNCAQPMWKIIRLYCF